MSPTAVLIRSKSTDPHSRKIYSRSHVAKLFDSIAHRYDFLNHLLSFGFDFRWRKKAIRLLDRFRPQEILDVGVGTADFALAAARLSPKRIVGVDISKEMLSRGRAKVERRALSHMIVLQEAAAEDLPFPSSTFDAVMVAFGVRNFEDLERGLREMHRVLREGGAALILEFSWPTRTPFRQLYAFYFARILPVLGGLVSRNRSAYEYLPITVNEFPDRKDFAELLESVGFAETEIHPVTLGIANIYLGIKGRTTNL